jgi:hypothetical protein
MFQVVVIVRINKCVGIWGILNFHLLRVAFPHWLPREILLKEGVL